MTVSSQDIRESCGCYVGQGVFYEGIEGGNLGCAREVLGFCVPKEGLQAGGEGKGTQR